MQSLQSIFYMAVMDNEKPSVIPLLEAQPEVFRPLLQKPPLLQFGHIPLVPPMSLSSL